MRATDRGLTEKPCSRCKATLPISSFRWMTRKDGRKDCWSSYCKPCENDRHKLVRDEARKKGTLPEGLPAEKKCSRCGETKPSSQFHARIQYRKWKLLDACKVCCNVRRKEWAAKNRNRVRVRSRLYYTRLRIALEKVRGAAPDDYIRKLMAYAPSKAETEGEMLAYFKGYLAGAKRTGAEDSRFSKLQDLCHRIASEVKQKSHIGYEEALSAAYEGLLGFIRKDKTWENDEHERAAAAQAIRWAITDYKRLHGDIGRTGKVRNTSITFSQIEQEDNPIANGISSSDALPSDLGSALDALDLKPVDREITTLVSQGWKLKEIGDKLGITESRVGQRLKNLGKAHGERLLAALS